MDIDDPDDYSAFIIDPVRSERLLSGEAFNMGRYYFGLNASQELHPMVHLSHATRITLLAHGCA